MPPTRPSALSMYSFLLSTLPFSSSVMRLRVNAVLYCMQCSSLRSRQTESCYGGKYCLSSRDPSPQSTPSLHVRFFFCVHIIFFMLIYSTDADFLFLRMLALLQLAHLSLSTSSQRQCSIAALLYLFFLRRYISLLSDLSYRDGLGQARARVGRRVRIAVLGGRARGLHRVSLRGCPHRHEPNGSGKIRGILSQISWMLFSGCFCRV